MLGERLLKARQIGRRTFKKYHSFNPRNQKEADGYRVNWRGEIRYDWTEVQVMRLTGIYSKTKVPCSQRCCGHKRDNEGIPIKEVRQYQEGDNQLEEIGYPHRKHGLYYGYEY